jgi:hypothetical protein
LKRLYTLFYDRVHITTGSFVFWSSIKHVMAAL